ncbi:hypothetical protein HanOQP8_Chr02g0076741 [Helianthus annuus]|nr:hypothetical protein HanIR_Chr02g0088311 [Helianthus annuus]KAJ0777908.1 hypothetical protein HanLR1_Chr02g0065841 [Helianthus annuus]KAJ0786918.1 hypothetical protein HanOQP8_Chr02g0076741 [Helianthus annuus]
MHTGVALFSGRFLLWILQTIGCQCTGSNFNWGFTRIKGVGWKWVGVISNDSTWAPSARYIKLLQRKDQRKDAVRLREVLYIQEG